MFLAFAVLLMATSGMHTCRFARPWLLCILESAFTPPYFYLMSLYLFLTRTSFLFWERLYRYARFLIKNNKKNKGV